MKLLYKKELPILDSPLFELLYCVIYQSLPDSFESGSVLVRSEVDEQVRLLRSLHSVVKQGSNISFVHVFSGVVFCTGVNVGNRLAFPGFVG